ncbi:MAG: hypothetical protein R2795_15020 [Saprospiraceae bacterium]
MGVLSAHRWHFLTGEKDTIFRLADDFLNVAVDDWNAPGGVDHSGRIVLVDTAGYVRSFANGNDPQSVDAFIKDVEQLLNQFTAPAPTGVE